MELKNLIGKIDSSENIEIFIKEMNGKFNIKSEKIDIRREENIENNNYSYEDAPLLYIEEISNLDRLSDEELNKAIEDVDNNMEPIINTMLKDVVRIAFKFYIKGIDFLDLVQEGNIGVIEGLDFYKKSYGDIVEYLKSCATYKIVKNIQEQFEYQKNNYKLILKREIDEKKDDENEHKLLLRKLDIVDNLTILDLPKKMSYIEEEFLLKFYGIIGGKKCSIFELEEENSIEHGEGEIIFDSAIKKLGLVGGKIIGSEN